jgi:hypothetical protein
MMLTDTMYELALRELSGQSDPAKEMLDEAAKTTAAALAKPDGEEREDGPPPGPCGQGEVRTSTS